METVVWDGSGVNMDSLLDTAQSLGLKGAGEGRKHCQPLGEAKIAFIHHLWDEVPKESFGQPSYLLQNLAHRRGSRGELSPEFTSG